MVIPLIAKRPILSICIPTYNRAAYLSECLDSIVNQNEKTLQQIEIVIVDNASIDNTRKIVEGYQKKYPNIVYHRNERNLGFDRSFTKLIEKSSGIYCLSIGDDDAFLERESLAFVIEKIKDEKIPFFGLNCWGYDANLKYAVLSHPNLQIQDDLYYPSLYQYVHTIKKYTNLVGIFVGLSTQLFKRDPWIACAGKEQYFDTLAVHMYVNLSVYRDAPFMIIARPVIKTRSSNIRWDVFAGLETIQGRVTSTLAIVSWIKKTFNLPIPNGKLYLYFYTREYWFTLKELTKRALAATGLQNVITYYRKIR